MRSWILLLFLSFLAPAHANLRSCPIAFSEDVATPLQALSEPVKQIDFQTLEANWRALRGLHQNQRVMTVLKADAYGHGLVRSALFLEKLGQELFAVANVREAKRLRDADLRGRILVLNPVAPEHWPYCSKTDIEVTVSTMEQIGLLRSLGTKLKVHVKVNTGMSRRGEHFSHGSLVAVALAAAQNIEVMALFSHFAESENLDSGFAAVQFQRFLRFKREFLRGYSPSSNIEYHIANSAAMIRNPLFHLSYARLGKSLWGPVSLSSKNSRRVWTSSKPVMTVKAPIDEIHRISAGDTVGYNQKYKANKSENIAILPIGFSNGVPRSLSNKGEVVIRGKRYPIVGNISMNSIAISLGEDIYPMGEPVYLIGGPYENAVSVPEWISLIPADPPTISSEIYTALGNGLPDEELEPSP